ncbi:MAG: TetR/AcrR family transcriptional regulator [Anaerolineales bacterium]|nr:TetR/AcrR family transcriptional regulator [Anaerolineales bacterium]
MPKQTFLNLPEEKRNFIINAAADEFAEYGFEAASINRIVANSKISKGSFYQYFEDKADVFRGFDRCGYAGEGDLLQRQAPAKPGSKCVWLFPLAYEDRY